VEVGVYYREEVTTMATTEARKRANKKYDDAHTKQYHLKLNLKTDADIIDRLTKQGSAQGYIKELIREDMKNNP
jgi:hypothetical protein